MAMVEEQGSIATVCEQANFGAFCGKVTIDLLRGRVYIAVLRVGGANSTVLCGIVISPRYPDRTQFLLYGGKAGLRGGGS